MLVLERLSDAQRNGHQVLALIPRLRDQPGRRLQRPHRPERPLPGAGDPPGAGQRRPRADVDAVEAHGTGTTLGDPIEAGALLATYGQERETAAVARLDQVQHRPHPGGGRRRRRDQDGDGDAPRGAAEDPARRRPHPTSIGRRATVELLDRGRVGAQRRPRRAAVSSFGISGTNAHVILEEAPAPRSRRATRARQVPRSRPPRPLGQSRARPARAAERLAPISRTPELDPPTSPPWPPPAPLRAPCGRPRRGRTSCWRLGSLAAGEPTPAGQRKRQGRQARLPLHRPGRPARRRGQELYAARFRAPSTPSASARRPAGGPAARDRLRGQEGRPARSHRLRPAGALRPRGRPLWAFARRGLSPTSSPVTRSARSPPRTSPASSPSPSGRSSPPGAG